jgi:hypothetical protein
MMMLFSFVYRLVSSPTELVVMVKKWLVRMPTIKGNIKNYEFNTVKAICRG